MTDTVTLFRPTGGNELALVAAPDSVAGHRGYRSSASSTR
jgi:hypothetical protein